MAEVRDKINKKVKKHLHPHRYDSLVFCAALRSRRADVGATAAYPALLAAAEVKQDRAALRPLARALLVAYVRHTVMGRLENVLLENAFYGVAKLLRDEYDVAGAIQTLIDFAPNDDAFLELHAGIDQSFKL